MPATKSSSASSAKWVAKAGQASGDYKNGVQAPKASWSSQTKAAEGAYDQGVQEAIGRKAFGRGVSQAGDAGWQAGAVNKGVTRYPSGVQAAQGKYQTAVEPYLSAISSTTLSTPRGPRGSAGNYQRSQQIGEVLHTKRISQTA